MNTSWAGMKVVMDEEFRRQVRRPGYRLLTLSVPLLLLLALVIVPVVRAIADSDDGKPTRLGYVDGAGLSLASAGTAELVEFAASNVGLAALEAGDIEALFVLGPDYLATGRVQWYDSGGSFFSDEGNGDRFRSALAVSLITGRVEDDLATRLLEPALFNKFKLDEDGVPRPDDRSEAEEAAKFFVPYIFAVALMIGVFSAGGYLLQSVAEDKENRMVELMITSVSPLSIMGGKIIALGAAGLIQIAVWFVAVLAIGPRLMEQIPSAGELPVTAAVILPVIAVFLAGYFMYAVLMAALGSAAGSIREATQFSAVLAIPNVISIYGSPLIIDVPNGTFGRILTFVPFTAPTAVMVRIGVGDVPLVDVLGALAIMLVTGFGLLWVAARVFRAGLLLYGQRMGIRAVWRAIRQAG